MNKTTALGSNLDVRSRRTNRFGPIGQTNREGAATLACMPVSDIVFVVIGTINTLSLFAVILWSGFANRKGRKAAMDKSAE